MPFQIKFSKSQSTSSVSIDSNFYLKAKILKNKSELIAYNRVLNLMEQQAILVGNHVHGMENERGEKVKPRGGLVFSDSWKEK